MIPINDYQKKIYQKLKEINYKIFDEVPVNETLPLITIGEYSFSAGSIKGKCYIFDQDIDMYSDYEGKKEINEMVSVVINKLESLVNENITDAFFISDIKLDTCTVTRQEEGIYNANLKLKIEIEV